MNALVKDGWTITANPLRLRLGRRDIQIDLGAERLLGVERGAEKIAVEIKTFENPSPVSDLQDAVGQFGMYEEVLSVLEPERLLFLAVPTTAWNSIFQEEIGQLMWKRRIRRIISYSVQEEKGAEWVTM